MFEHKLGRGWQNWKTAQIIAIISHLEKYVHTVYLFKNVLENEVVFQNLPVYQKSVPNTLKVHIYGYLYHWAVQVYISIHM